MTECMCDIPIDLYDDITERTKKLGISESEYFKLLATLDTSIEMYQRLKNYLEFFYDVINDIYIKLKIDCVPLQLPKMNNK